MESYKEVRKRVIERRKTCENELLELIEVKKLCYQQYNSLFEDNNVLCVKLYERNKKKEDMEYNRLNILRIIESLFFVTSFALIVRFLGLNILPMIQYESLGVIFMVAGSLLSCVIEIILAFKIDNILSVKVIRGLTRNKKYKKLIEEIEKYKTKVNFKNIDEEKKKNEYNEYVLEEDNIRKKIINYNNLISLLDSLIEEDENMDNIKIDDNKLVKKRVKDNN